MALRYSRQNYRNILNLFDDRLFHIRSTATVQLWSIKHTVSQGNTFSRSVSSTPGSRNVLVPRYSPAVQPEHVSKCDEQTIDEKLEELATDFFRGNDHFAQRHIGPRIEDRDKMLQFLGCQVGTGSPALRKGCSREIFAGFGGFIVQDNSERHTLQKRIGYGSANG